jgi:hypothetical protein
VVIRRGDDCVVELARLLDGRSDGDVVGLTRGRGSLVMRRLRHDGSHCDSGDGKMTAMGYMCCAGCAR